MMVCSSCMPKIVTRPVHAFVVPGDDKNAGTSSGTGVSSPRREY